MIQKRFQYYSSSGIEWTNWFDYSDDNSLVEELKKENKQLGKLLNQYRVV